jgi:hypothetical protein
MSQSFVVHGFQPPKNVQPCDMWLIQDVFRVVATLRNEKQTFSSWVVDVRNSQEYHLMFTLSPSLDGLNMTDFRMIEAISPPRISNIWITNTSPISLQIKVRQTGAPGIVPTERIIRLVNDA